MAKRRQRPLATTGWPLIPRSEVRPDHDPIGGPVILYLDR
jgi:hypothetical protein